MSLIPPCSMNTRHAYPFKAARVTTAVIHLSMVYFLFLNGWWCSVDLVTFLDTAGQEQYSEHRKESIIHSHGFLLVYDVTQRYGTPNPFLGSPALLSLLALAV